MMVNLYKCSSFVFQSLTKSPDSYPDAKSLPHVLVASRLLKRGVRVQAGDVVPYIICKNTPSSEVGVGILYH